VQRCRAAFEAKTLIPKCHARDSTSC
jgi:hypothetical protein